MSKTERALSSSEHRDALDDLFADDSFDAAFDEAVDEADRDLDVAPRHDDEPHTHDDGPDAALDDAVSADLSVDGQVVDSESETGVEATSDADVAGEWSDDDGPPTAEIVLRQSAPDESVESDDHLGSVGERLDPPAVDDLDDRNIEHDGLPEIVQAIPDLDGRGAHPLRTHDTDLDEHTGIDTDTDVDEDADDVSDQILEELRRADIDGPVVAPAPQDDITRARRRPKRTADYDPAPVPIPARVPRILGRKARVRKVTRVVRSVDPWSIFKVALVAHMVVYVIVLTASVLLWNVANATGTVDNVERFFESFGWDTFQFNGGELYHAGWIAGLFVVIGMTGLAVLTATLFNLITDLVGGVRFTVLEEEVVETRTSPMRRFVVRRTEPEIPAVIRDGSGAMVREAVVDDTGANARPTR